MLINIENLLEDYRRLSGDIDDELHRQYSISFLSKKNFRENDIFQVYTKVGKDKKRIGWIFPVFVIGSGEYDLFNDEHFSEYVKIGASYFLNNSLVCDDNTHALVLKNETLTEAELSAEDLSTAFLGYGYYPVECGVVASNGLSEIDNGVVNKLFVYKGRAVKDYAPYVGRLISDILPKIEDPLSRFVSIYQTIELLMERFFYYRVECHRDKRATIGTIRDSISELSNERKLINLIFAHCRHRQKLNVDESDLVRRLFGDDKEESYYSSLILPNFVYDIRNAIIHNYHKYELSGMMVEISDRMELIWAELLRNPEISDFLLVGE